MDKMTAGGGLMLGIIGGTIFGNLALGIVAGLLLGAGAGAAKSKIDTREH